MRVRYNFSSSIYLFNYFIYVLQHHISLLSTYILFFHFKYLVFWQQPLKQHLDALLSLDTIYHLGNTCLNYERLMGLKKVLLVSEKVVQVIYPSFVQFFNIKNPLSIYLQYSFNMFHSYPFCDKI